MIFCRHPVFGALALLLAFARADAATIYVSASSGSDANSGTTAATAVRTVTRASSLLVDGDTLRIAAGTYSAAGGETLPIRLFGSVTVIGDGPRQTVLDGADTAQVLVLSAGAAASITLRGIGIANGFSAVGAGVNLGFARSVSIENCRFSGNVGRIGGALFVNASGATSAGIELTVSDSVFADNEAGSGTDIQFQQNNSSNNTLRLLRSHFEGARSSNASVGFQENNGGVRTLIVDRTAFIGGSADGIALLGGAPSGSTVATISNSLFALHGRSGVSAAGRSISIINSTLADNARPVAMGPGSRLLNSIVWSDLGQSPSRTGIQGSGGTVAHSLVQNLRFDGHLDVGSNTGENPFFFPNYRLPSGSPAIDAGDDSVVIAEGLNVDFDGHPRRFDYLGPSAGPRRVDMGFSERNYQFRDGFESP